MATQQRHTKTKRCEDVGPGDIIEFLSHLISVDRIEPPTATDPEWVIGRAKDIHGVGMTLEAGRRVDIM